LLRSQTSELIFDHRYYSNFQHFSHKMPFNTRVIGNGMTNEIGFVQNSKVYSNVLNCKGGEFYNYEI